MGSMLVTVFNDYDPDNTGKLKTPHDGPLPTQQLEAAVSPLLPASAELLGSRDDFSDVRIADVLRFLSLTTRREHIDVSLGDPHSVFLPCGRDAVFIDYAWLDSVLYNLFFGVQLREQHFKGPILEHLVHQGKSALPTAECNSFSGESRQIDAAFDLKNLLVIIECRAVGRSFGIERGEPAALAFRRAKIDKALHDVDEKAHWLASHPIGRNYDIRKYHRILPIAITPFVEFIDSLDPRYWLSSELPRVLSPGELRHALEDGSFERLASASLNTVLISVKDA